MSFLEREIEKLLSHEGLSDEAKEKIKEFKLASDKKTKCLNEAGTDVPCINQKNSRMSS